MNHMMPSRKQIGLVVLSIFACVSWICAGEITQKALEEKGVLLSHVGKDAILCVINFRGEGGASWYLLRDGGDNRKLGSNLSQLMEVHDLSVSPNIKYLAVLSVGEGHPMIEVVDLQVLRIKNKYKALHVVDPYPGTAQIVAWDGDRLILESDMPLNLRGADGRVNPDLVLPNPRRFTLDVPTGTIRPANEGR